MELEYKEQDLCFKRLLKNHLKTFAKYSTFYMLSMNNNMVYTPMQYKYMIE
jgi:hypothetical protein